MRIEALSGRFAVCQVENANSPDWSRPFTFLCRTDEELSLVCPEEQVPSDAICREDGWRAFRIQGPLDFSLIGVLAEIASILAEERISIFAMSTYNTDYVLVKEECFAGAMEALKKNGYELAEQHGI